MASALLYLLALLNVTGALPRNQREDVTAIEAAVARYAMTHFLKGSVALDTTNALMLRVDQLHPPRSREEVARLQKILHGAKVGALADFRICADPNNINTCGLRGADAVLSMGRPVITGDTAIVTIRIIAAHTSVKGQSFTASRSERIQLARKDAKWLIRGLLAGGSVS